MTDPNIQKSKRNFGSVYTPSIVASFLARWAIRSSAGLILDLGVGEGIFSFAAYERLCELGASASDASSQIYGVEVRDSAYQAFLTRQNQINVILPNIQQGNFFAAHFPQVDAVIGNPPYVRRRHLNNIDALRQTVMPEVVRTNIYLPLQTDLYIYFLLHACSLLKMNGRLAVIVTDSWMNVGYGKPFKQYLLNNFHIEHLISLDKRVFDADVKAVMLLATKKVTNDQKSKVQFTRLVDTAEIDCLPIQQESILTDTNPRTVEVCQMNLSADFPWSVYQKSPKLHQHMMEHKRIVPLSKIANTRIGIQSLANDFFVLTSEQAKLENIEDSYLTQLAYTPKSPAPPVIKANTKTPFQLFSCSDAKEIISGTRALSYIERAEKATVGVRGKDVFVTGYNNKERIKRSGRSNWYDLKSAITKRGCANILLPRFIYNDYKVVWNQAGFVPLENYIEILPLEQSKNPDEATMVLLAILSSSITEVAVRIYSQVYGGGTYSVSPGLIKTLPIVDARTLNSAEKRDLVRSYEIYISDGNNDRAGIDQAVFKILGYERSLQLHTQEVLEELKNLSKTSKMYVGGAEHG